MRVSADQGHEKAQQNLGLMYLRGHGVTQNNIKAYMWLNIAAANGAENAAKLREQVESKMSPEQLNKGQAMSKECLSSNYGYTQCG